jgi:magnesium transporter
MSTPIMTKKAHPLHIVSYSEQTATSCESQSIEEIFSKIEPNSINWINAVYRNNPEMITRILTRFHIDPSLQEKICSDSDSPLIEEYNRYLFIKLKIMNINLEEDRIEKEWVSFIAMENVLLSFESEGLDTFEPLRKKILHEQGKTREKNVEQLLFHILKECIVMKYFFIGKTLDDRLDDLEEELILGSDRHVLKEIFSLRQRVKYCKEYYFQIMELFEVLSNEDVNSISQQTQKDFKETFTIVLELGDMYKSLKGGVSELLEIYRSNNSEKMNRIMKLLTIVSTIFLPLAFITGFYGMNFVYMPELAWKWSYPVVIIVILAVSIMTIMIMKRKKWF